MRKAHAGEEGGFGASKGLRIIPLGGCEEVGRNMTVFEYGRDIVIVDMGLQFPDEDMPGIDYVIPNTRYLEGKEENIRAVIFTHGHLDHIGAAPILLEKLGNPPIVGRDFTLALIKDRQEDYRKGSSRRLKTMRIANLKDTFRLGSFTARFFQIEHSIMDAVGIILENPAGTIIHSGDWAMERDENGKPTIDYTPLRNLPRPTVLMLESLGATKKEKMSASEDMYRNLRDLIGRAPGRVIIGTFASQITRLKWILETAEELGKKVALEGRSMKKNVEIAKKLGYIKAKKDVVIETKDLDGYPDKRIIVVCTGAQGEENAALPRIVNREHRHIRLKKSDTVIFSSSVIPGNEQAIQRLKDNIYRQSDHVIHSEIMDVHVSGHANRKDIADMVAMAEPTYFIPVYANHYMLKEAAKIAIAGGFAPENVVVPDNGSIITIQDGKIRAADRKAPTSYVFVDGLGISDMQNVVLRDRQVLSEDGIVVVIVGVDAKSGKLLHEPDIISRGFVFLKENKGMIKEMKKMVGKMAAKARPLSRADADQIKRDIREKIGKFLLAKTLKRPMILPVVIGL